jgi:ATP-dependent DNA helicase RecQ
MSTAEQKGVLIEVEAGQVHLLYVSPERLLKNPDLEESLRRVASKGDFRRLVLDEAHCLSEMGHDFRPDYRRVRERLTQIMPIYFPVSALTATATRSVLRDLKKHLGLERIVPIRASTDRANLMYHTKSVSGKAADEEKLKHILMVLEWVKSTHRKDPTGWSVIIYGGTKDTCEHLAQTLSKFEYNAHAYHAGLHKRVRGEIQEAFTDGRIDIIVATSAFGMGVDKPNVRAVIHYRPPFSLSQYIQEAGRAGRDDQAAHALLLHSSSDWYKLGRMNRQDTPERVNAKKLLELLTVQGGRLTALINKLIEALHPSHPDDVADPATPATAGNQLEPSEMLWLLDALAQAKALDYEYRVGTVQLLARTQEALKTGFDADGFALLAQLNFVVGPKAQTLDLSGLDRDQAEALCGTLQQLARDSFDVIFKTLEPAYQVTLKPNRQALADFDLVLTERQRRRAKDLKAIREYADQSPCLRTKLLKLFDDKPDDHRDLSSCCSGCSNGNEPWYKSHRFTDEEIRDVHRAGATILEYLDQHRHDFKAWRQRKIKDDPTYQLRNYTGLGASTISMVLRGETERFIGGNQIKKLPFALQKTDFYGCLHFVADKEIRNELKRAAEQNWLQSHPHEHGLTFSITPAGEYHWRQIRRAKESSR